MKTTIILFAALSSLLHAQGPLDPPAGPTPMMKSLDQIEPRIPISSLPYIISKSGSYYFTGNLVFTEDAGDAITITASHVTLDLMGFTLSSKASVTGDGISIPNSDNQGIAIRNGSIVGNTSVVKSGSPMTWTVTKAGFENGINSNSFQASYEDLSLSGARSSGLISNRSPTVNNVRSRNNGGRGISASGGSVTHSTAVDNGGIGIMVPGGAVISCKASGNGSYGIFTSFGSVNSSSAFANGDAGIVVTRGSVTGSAARSNNGIGISANYGVVTGCAAHDNDGDGIAASYGTVTGSSADSNAVKGISVFGGSVTGSSATENGTNGIYASLGNITNSTASSNTEADISASNAVVAFCRFTTFAMTNSSRTGNFPSP